MKEGTNNKTLDIILFACSRGVGNSLLHCSRPKGMKVIRAFDDDVTSKQLYVTNFSSQIPPLYAVKKGE